MPVGVFRPALLLAGVLGGPPALNLRNPRQGLSLSRIYPVPFSGDIIVNDLNIILILIITYHI